MQPGETPFTEHPILELWVRPVTGGPMQPREQLDLVAGHGVRDDHTFGRMRHVTIVFEDDWNEAVKTLGLDAVDPAGRRANVLVAGAGGARYVGTRVRLGGALLEIKAITNPCPVMDRAAPGMQEALRPHGRAGIWGRVLEGGTIVRGDALRAAPPAAAATSSD